MALARSEGARGAVLVEGVSGDPLRRGHEPGSSS
jgi:hypothetical protein